MILLRFIRALSSRQLTGALLLGLVFSYIYFTFGVQPFEDWLHFLFKSTAGLIIYAALILNLSAISIKAAAYKLKDESISPELIKSMDAWLKIPTVSADTMGDVAEIAKKAGFGMEVSGATAVSRRGRYSFLPGTVFRGGIIIVMMAAALSVNLRRSERGILYEGGEKELLGKIFKLESVSPGLPETFLQVGEKSSFSLNEVSAVISLSEGKYTVTPGLPTKARGTYLRITNLGYTQPISGRTGSAVFDWDVFLEVLPPGKVDSKTLLSNLNSLSFTLAPSKTIEKGLITGKLYNIKQPMYSLSLIDTATGKHSESVIASPSETVRVGDVDITLGKNSVYIQLQAVEDPALRWLYLGLSVLIIGTVLLLSRFFWYERKLYAFRTYEAVLVGYSEEFYKKWGILKFQSLRESLLSHVRNRE